MRARNVLLAMVIIIGGLIVTSWHRGSLAELRASQDWRDVADVIGAAVADIDAERGAWRELGTSTRRIAAADAKRLVVDNPGGDVSISADAGDAVIVRATLFGRGDAAEAARLSAHGIRLQTTSEGEAVTVVVSGPRRAWRRARFDLTITAPPRLIVAAKSVAGGMRVSGMMREVTASTVADDLDIEGGRRVSAKSVGGDVRISDTAGPVQARSVGGNITVSGVPSVEASSTGGFIDLSRVTGRLQARTIGGSVRIGGFRGNSAVVSSVGGSITAELVEPFSGELRAKTTSGSVSVSMPTDSDCSVDLSSMGGQLRTDLPLRGLSRSRTRVTGVLGAGRGRIELRSSSGLVSAVAAARQEASSVPPKKGTHVERAEPGDAGVEPSGVR